MMTLGQVVVLSMAGAAAGMINAVAGGGTLVTFPVLLWTGVSAVTANATSTAALVVGTAGSMFGFRSEIKAVRPWLVRFLPISLVGGLLGSYLVTRFPERVFEALIPWLILFATVLFFLQGPVKKWLFSKSIQSPASTDQPGPGWGPMVFQFFVAVYGGYFGAGIGILMLASLGLMGMTHIHRMNTIKTILGSLINVVAAVYFVASGLVDWPRMAVMSAASLAGYFAGAHYSQRIPQDKVRTLITFIGMSLSVWMLYRQIGR